MLARCRLGDLHVELFGHAEVERLIDGVLAAAAGAMLKKNIQCTLDGMEADEVKRLGSIGKESEGEDLVEAELPCFDNNCGGRSIGKDIQELPEVPPFPLDHVQLAEVECFDISSEFEEDASDGALETTVEVAPAEHVETVHVPKADAVLEALPEAPRDIADAENAVEPRGPQRPTGEAAVSASTHKVHSGAAEAVAVPVEQAAPPLVMEAGCVQNDVAPKVAGGNMEDVVVRVAALDSPTVVEAMGSSVDSAGCVPSVGEPWAVLGGPFEEGQDVAGVIGDGRAADYLDFGCDEAPTTSPRSPARRGGRPAHAIVGSGGIGGSGSSFTVGPSARSEQTQEVQPVPHVEVNVSVPRAVPKEVIEANQEAFARASAVRASRLAEWRLVNDQLVPFSMKEQGRQRGSPDGVSRELIHRAEGSGRLRSWADASDKVDGPSGQADANEKQVDSTEHVQAVLEALMAEVEELHGQGAFDLDEMRLRIARVFQEVGGWTSAQSELLMQKFLFDLPMAHGASDGMVFE